MTQQLSPHFAQGIMRNLAYWQQRIEVDEDHLLYQEQDNILVAVRFGLRLADSCSTAAELCLEVFLLVERWGKWDTWASIIEKAVVACSQMPLAVQIRLVNRQGQLQSLLGRINTAVATHQNALALADSAADSTLQAEIHFNLCRDYGLQGDYDEAERHGLMALATFRQLPSHERWLATVLNRLGINASKRGDFRLATERLEEAVTIWQSVAEPTELGRTLNNLAIALQEQGKYQLAMEKYRAALAQLENTNSEVSKSRVYNSLGVLHFMLKSFAEAEDAFRRANSAALRQSGSLATSASIQSNLGKVLTEQARYEEAEIYLRRGLALWQQMDNKIEAANILGALAELKVLQGESQMAYSLFDEAIEILTDYLDNTRGARLWDEFKQSQQALE